MIQEQAEVREVRGEGKPHRPQAELEREAGHDHGLARATGDAGGRLMPEKLELSPDYWRKRAEEARTIAELITDKFTRETMEAIARQYDELAERAERRQRWGN
jgi:hypothetical protein